ncbi:MAG: protein TolQ [Deltaproteobacteria bacterium]|nr:protein TolQ [Deltaproteobacteria bacterium]
MALGTGPVVGGVLLLLVACSVVSWAVILYKWRVIHRASQESREFLEAFWRSKNFQSVMASSKEMSDSPLAEIFRSGYQEWRRIRTRFAKPHSEEGEEDLSTELGSLESIQRTLRRSADAEVTRLERMLIFLATVASAAPFVGLFGTVWGIMDSFRHIGAVGSANLAVVAPGISEALIATATGLAAAIPAVVAYNYLNNAIKILSTEMDAFSAEFLNIVSHHLATSPRSAP